jgi:hypothetical protein
VATHNYVTQKIPAQLGFFPTGASSRYANPSGSYDYAFGGVPFLSAAGTSPYTYGQPRALTRSTASFKRDQFDSSAEPGEQSLMGWWLRSQSSFHLGAGLRFEDPTLDEQRFRYESSTGVDVFTPGQISLLPTTTQRVAGTTPVLCHGAVDGTTDIVLFSTAATLKRVTSGSSATVTWGGSGNILALTDDGSSYYAANATSIYKGTLAGGNGAALWNTGSSAVTMAWVKQRLMAGIGPSIYQLAGGTPPTLPTATYTHPNSAWVWTSISEGPSAIYVSGYAGGRSAIVKLTVDNTGTLPTLTQASTVAEMPPGEIIYKIAQHTGTFLAIGTSKGVRVAQIDSTGSLAVGPIIPTPSPCKALTSYSDSFYAGYSGGFTDGSGLLRINLSTQLNSGSYPYSTHLNAHAAGDVTGVCVRGGSGVLAFAVDGNGLYEQHATDLETAGTLTTFRIRYSAQWPKLYKRLAVRAIAPYSGTINVSSIDQTGTATSLATVAPSLDPTTDINISRPSGPQQHIQVAFRLNRSGSSNTAGPTMIGYQLKALPGGPRPREIVVPLLCHDWETDRNGARKGYDGYALDRLSAMEAFDSVGDLVLFEDLVAGTAELVLIEQLQFSQQSPPAANEAVSGVLAVTCRTVD